MDTKVRLHLLNEFKMLKSKIKQVKIIEFEFQVIIK